MFQTFVDIIYNVEGVHIKIWAILPFPPGTYFATGNVNLINATMIVVVV